jgi:CIC family chloride channel protein
MIAQLRESGTFLSYVKQWVPLTLVVGTSSGIVMIAFYYAIQAVQYLFMNVPVYMSMIAGGVVSSVLIWRGMKKIQGSGVHHYIGCRKGIDNIEPRDIGAKFLASSAAIGSGCIAGKEGPALFIGGGIALLWARLLKFPANKRKMTATIGGAAATSAIFQTPLGGAIFAAEVPYRHDIDAPEYMPAFLSSLISYFIFRFGLTLITGDVPRILDLHITTSLSSPRHFLNAFLAGIVAGLVGVVFVKAFHYTRTKIAPRFRPEVSALIGVAVPALITFTLLKIVSEDVPFGGTGFQILNYIESSPGIGLHVLIALLVATVFACSLTVAMNVSGGVFGPALVVGGCTGAITGIILDPGNVSSYAVIGMSAVHTATTKTPIASLVLIMEMTDFPPIFLAMAIANVAAFFISGDSSMYHTQMRGRFEEVIQKLTEMDVLSQRKVRDIMETDAVSLLESDTVSEARKIFSSMIKQSLPIINSDNVLKGILSLVDIREADESTPVTDIMTEPLLTLKPDESLEEALYRFYDSDVNQAPVINEDGGLIGFMTLRDIIRTYRRHVAGLS